ncbi:MAG: DUF3667 domain-containing protein [Cytophagales bacterium]|nr:DUF3667 domain-containing protein [Cytophagales bacterium]
MQGQPIEIDWQLVECLNCTYAYKGHYCPNCGQKYDTGRFSIPKLVHESFYSVFHLEKKGLFSTIKDLFAMPGTAIRAFIAGQRLILYPPIKYLVLIGTITVLLSARYQFFSNEFTSTDAQHNQQLLSALGLESYSEKLDEFFLYGEKYATLLNIVAIPVFAFFSWLLFFNSKFNFAENLVLNTYISAQQLLILLAFVPFFEVYSFEKEFIVPIYTVVSILYNLAVYVGFFEEKLWLGIIKSTVVIILSYLGQFVLNVGVFMLIHPWIHHIPSH